jgi:hypothetical protein
MKTKLIIAFLCAGLTACEDDSSGSKQSELTNIAKDGTWRITYFFDSDTDETNHFTGYNFTFGASNELTATNGTNTYTGTWSITDSNSNDDSIDDLDFNINFAAPPDFEDLSDDWDIFEYTSTQIKLIDVSGGGGGTDYLTFQKN